MILYSQHEGKVRVRVVTVITTTVHVDVFGQVLIPSKRGVGALSREYGNITFDVTVITIYCYSSTPQCYYHTYFIGSCIVQKEGNGVIGLEHWTAGHFSEWDEMRTSVLGGCSNLGLDEFVYFCQLPVLRG